ncbi:hypothetical protein E1B28_003795 [Marasmius oreades]|uniref:Uncharacterized protein n=1 Tax=Marasmius oreades TaxID=181124 RepID=A0A9P7UX65_9AGAR|nr:uncharacterized protein E1B28_003795 [Marasmius oreades]KAG7096351.1 hypothetical protein E1B28_003795 [Marasmius oreades]
MTTQIRSTDSNPFIIATGAQVLLMSLRRDSIEEQHPKGEMLKGRGSGQAIKLFHKFNFDGSHDGAILLLPEGSWREMASFATSQLLQTRAMKHAHQWFQEAEKKLHRALDAREFLYLVTGYDKAFSWGISAFANEWGNPVSLTFSTHEIEDSHDKYSWSFEDISQGSGCRCHPDATDPYSSSSPTSVNRVPDQCVFVRGYVITR